MVPVPEKYLIKINYNYSSRLYLEEYYIKKHKNQIMKKAQYTYHNRNAIEDLCVDFKLIEMILKIVKY